MRTRYLTVDIRPNEATLPFRMAFRECLPPGHVKQRGVVLLIHGFPQTSLQYRHVLPLLAADGYRSIAPDYRGAGGSSIPVYGDEKTKFMKSTMASDMVALLAALHISDPAHVVGHDIGGMIAWALASRFPGHVQSVCWGECPLPGTKAYYDDFSKLDRTKQQFHFIFHCAQDGLAEALVHGRERMYISHFFARLTYNLDAFPSEIIDEYAAAYSKPGALASAFGVYRAFSNDALENQEHIQRHGMCSVPSMVLSGEHSRQAEEAEEMASTVTSSGNLEVRVIGAAGHYIAEENPEEFAAVLLVFLAKCNIT